MDKASVAGTVTRVDRRGRQIYCFEGHGLHKVGKGETISVTFGDLIHTGELVAISPGRAIVIISSVNPEHRIVDTKPAAVVA